MFVRPGRTPWKALGHENLIESADSHEGRGFFLFLQVPTLLNFTDDDGILHEHIKLNEVTRGHMLAGVTAKGNRKGEVVR